MKQPRPAPRASHVNFGTSVREEDLPWPEHAGPVMRLPRLHVETEERMTVTRFGGLALVQQFWKRFGAAKLIDERVRVFKLHLPYHESDHVLAQVLNLYVGGTCLEDQMFLQHDEGVLRMFGACRIPDPTTAGDFLRRFDRERRPGALAGLRRASNELQQRVWRQLSRQERRRRKRELCVLDVDGYIKEVCGVQKEGADFSYNGKWSYQPLLVSMASTGECVAVRNRPGNVRSGDGAAQVLDEVLPWMTEHFDNILVRGDSDFDRQDLREVIEHHDGYFAFVGRAQQGRPQLAVALPEQAYRPFLTRQERERSLRRKQPNYLPRRKKRNLRRECARGRNYKELLQTKQWVAETTYQPPGQPNVYRLIIRRKLIEHRQGQSHLFDDYAYSWVVTNLPATFSTQDVIDHTYQRCDQENVIEQMGSGLAGWRMPVAEFDGNSAWLEIARLAWNLGKWIAQLALLPEVVRWEWKRFRLHYVHVAAQVIKRARQIWLRLLGPPSTINPVALALDV